MSAIFIPDPTLRGDVSCVIGKAGVEQLDKYPERDFVPMNTRRNIGN
jgi:hypothetical protein